MDCSRVERLIPPFVGGDLDEAETIVVGAHLAACETCAASATELRETLDLVRAETEPDVDAEFYESIRRDVLSTLAAPAPPRRYWSTAVAASVALAALAALLVMLAMRSQPGDGAREEARDDRQPTIEPAPVRAKPAVEPERSNHTERRPAKTTRRVAPRTVPQMAALPAECLAVAEPLKLEFQTSDPNIRIIWFIPNEDGASSADRKNAR